MITWDDFKFSTGTNKQLDFENMCRILFNYYFFDNNAIFEQIHNNPGVEIEPLEDQEGKRISFQAKYFENTVNYQDIYDSAVTAKNIYADQLDVIYLFCNKEVNDSKKFNETKKLLASVGIKLIKFTNQMILDVIETKNYKTIKQLYFGRHFITNGILNEWLKTSLEDLEPRYVSGFNIDIDIQKYFDVKYLSSEFFNNLQEYKDQILQDISSIRIDDEIINPIINKITSIEIPSKENVLDIFNWHLIFESDVKELTKLLDKIINEISLCVDTKEKEKLYSTNFSIEKLIRDIQCLDLNKNELFSSLKTNVLFIEGDAGIGKSHLLGYEAEKYGNRDDRTILLLGQKLISNNSPIEQIKEQLNLSYDFDSFLDALEGLGEIDNSTTVIMLDAINECSNYSVWTNYLNTLINKISSYKHIKFIATIRSTYKDVIFSDIVKTKILNNDILLIKHRGFEGIVDEAVTKYFNHYNIPLTTTSYIAYEYNNPLLLKIYCMCYSKNDNLGFQSINLLFERYINEEERKIKTLINDVSSFPHFKTILKEVSKYMYNGKTSFITLEKLYDVCHNIPNADEYISYILKSKLLVSYYYNEEQKIYFGYERMLDFITSQVFIDGLDSYNNIIEKINKELFKRDNNGYFLNSNASGLFSALSILISEKYNKEIIKCLNELDCENYEMDQLIEDYISNLVYRKNDSINKKDIIEFLTGKELTIRIKDIFYNTLLILAGRKNNELNAYMLHEYLISKPLNIRDYNWTIFINDNFYENSNLYHIINYFENNDFIGDETEKKLYVIELSWFLTSSNRSLRDRASRCLVKLLRNDINIMSYLLLMFNNVNDSYLLQRLYGIIYGAILLSNNLINENLVSLCEQIYQSIFAKECVYEDILLRDYALNIIEYAKHLKCELSFDIRTCRPPYNSKPIEIISDEVESFFEYLPNSEVSGANLIKSSMMPNINCTYGDFGRYVFESALDDFDGIDIKNLYLFALKIIHDEYGYSNELFTYYDCKSNRYQGYDRHNTLKIERIGKKYQWMAFYKILAKVSDHYKLKLNHFEQRDNTYKGSWNPYVRDFDPTLTLISRDKVYNIDLLLSQPQYVEWNSNSEDWSNNEKDVMDFDNYIELCDNKNEYWIMLHANFKRMSSDDYKNDYREVWRMLSCYFIEKSQFNMFFEEMKNKPLWGRWFEESRERYNLFSHEYYWSPAYKDEYKEEVFSIDINPKPINNIIPGWNEYMWEEQYDASKEDVVSYYLPSSDISNFLGLTQKENGMFYKDEELVAIDFSIVTGNTEGLYIKKKYFDVFVNDKNLEPFWICVGEKNDVKKEGHFFASEHSMYMDMSSFIYRDDKKLKCINFFGNRREHQ